MVLSRLKARLRRRLNVAVSELDYQDKWQRGVIGVVSIASSRQVVEKTLHSALDEIDNSLLPGLILKNEIQFL